MCESRQLESESTCLESESTRIGIHLNFLESESESNSFESEFESNTTNVSCMTGNIYIHAIVFLSRVVIGDQKYESGFESESESTNFFLESESRSSFSRSESESESESSPKWLESGFESGFAHHCYLLPMVTVDPQTNFVWPWTVFSKNHSKEADFITFRAYDALHVGVTIMYWILSK